jgi:hypothetical protein
MPVGSDCTSGDTEPDPDKGVKLSQGEEAHARLRVPKLAAQTDRDSNDFEGRFRRHFPRRSNDFALVVLKGHLLMEESVNRLLAALLYRPEAIESANLRFHQKLCLIRALAPVGPNGVVFRFADAAEKLNTMRNRLAHHLDYPQMEAQATDFLSLCEDPEEADDPETEAVPLIRRLGRAIVFVCAAIEGISVGAKVTRDLERKRRMA